MISTKVIDHERLELVAVDSKYNICNLDTAE